MAFVAIVKPTHICNLACTYCYNDDVRDPIMKDDTLNRVIDQVVSYASQLPQPVRKAEFIWHGGEPTVPGLKFYEQVVVQQKQYSNVLIENSIQTNGVLIDEKWLEFFKDHNFGISISIDGPKHLHDRFRLDGRGRGSFDRVFAAIQRVKNFGLPVGVCIVISRANVDHIDEIFDFLVKHRLPFNVIPLNRSGSARENYDDVGLDEDEYGDAWIKMYDKWFDSGDEYVYCQDFALKTRAILQGKPADCIGLAHCADMNVSIDPVGDVYACATLSGHQETKYGNIVESSLVNLMHSSTALAFRDREVDPQCSECKWQHVCHGGCLARSYKFFGNHHRKDYYWPSLFKIYEHIAKRVLDQGFRVGDPYEDHMDKDHFATVPHMSPPSRGDVVPTHSVSKPTESISIPVVMEM